MSHGRARRACAIGVVSLFAAGAAPSAAPAETQTADGSATVVVPTGSQPHADCVSSTTTGTVCQQYPGGPDVTATASYDATATATPPAVSNEACPGGFATTASTGGADASGDATASGYLVSPTGAPVSAATPSDTVTYSHCITP